MFFKKESVYWKEGIKQNYNSIVDVFCIYCVFSKFFRMSCCQFIWIFFVNGCQFKILVNFINFVCIINLKIGIVR